MARKQFGVFTRPGQARRIAYSAAEAVQYEYDGWTRVADQIQKLPARATAPADKAADKAAEQGDAVAAPKKATGATAGSK